jgi:hypothetical protein
MGTASGEYDRAAYSQIEFQNYFFRMTDGWMVELLGCADHVFYVTECCLSLNHLYYLNSLHTFNHFLRVAAFYLIFLSPKQIYNFSVCTFPVSESTV